MCGIVGIVGKSDVAQRLFDGLKRLEYRGYDSAGICTIDGGQLVRRRAEGKLDNLARELEADPLHGSVGIAHTRWATHGAPTVGNAHPHIVGPVALVHNGIIENFKPLRDELIAEARKFESETDTEVVGHLVAREVERGASPEDAVAAVLPRLSGAFAIVGEAGSSVTMLRRLAAIILLACALPVLAAAQPSMSCAPDARGAQAVRQVATGLVDADNQPVPPGVHGFLRRGHPFAPFGG